VPVAEDLGGRRRYLVDGTPLPSWSWPAHPQLYSGKHKTAGRNVQVARDHDGRPAWISDPADGARHDYRTRTYVIDSRYPMVGDACEARPGGPYLAGHPVSQEIFH
jgi:hypothetical protein